MLFDILLFLCLRRFPAVRRLLTESLHPRKKNLSIESVARSRIPEAHVAKDEIDALKLEHAKELNAVIEARDAAESELSEQASAAEADLQKQAEESKQRESMLLAKIAVMEEDAEAMHQGRSELVEEHQAQLKQLETTLHKQHAEQLEEMVRFSFIPPSTCSSTLTTITPMTQLDSSNVRLCPTREFMPESGVVFGILHKVRTSDDMRNALEAKIMKLEKQAVSADDSMQEKARAAALAERSATVFFLFYHSLSSSPLE